MKSYSGEVENKEEEAQGEAESHQLVPEKKITASAQKDFGPARVKGVRSERSVSPNLVQ